MLRGRCPRCSRKFAVSEQLAGRRATCPNCGHEFVLSKPDSASENEIILDTSPTTDESDNAYSFVEPQSPVPDETAGPRVVSEPKHPSPLKGAKKSEKQSLEGRATLTVSCPRCSTSMRAPYESVGRKAKCGTCGHTFVVQRAEALDSEEIFESIAVETDEDFKPLDPPRTSTFVPEPVPLLLQPLRLPQRESKKCPFCAETIAAEAIKCRFCGSMLVPLPNESRHLQDPNLILPKAIPESPVLMAILSGCVIAGAGQMVMGQVAKGVVFLLGALVLAVLTAGISIFFTWPLMGIDAYLVAKKLNAGEPVTRWECFPIS